MPASREAWPADVLAAAAKFKCGDVVEDPPYFYVANPAFAVMEWTFPYNDDQASASEIIDASDMAAPFGLITSQTCDVGEIGFPKPSKPFIAVSPIFDGQDLLDGGIRKLLRAGRQIQGWVHLPALSDRAPGFWVADLRLEMPIEKSWLVGRVPIQGFATEEDARQLPARIDAIRSRPAWSQVIVDEVQGPLAASLRELKTQDRLLFDQVSLELAEIGAAADSLIAPATVQLAVFHELPVSAQVREWWIEMSGLLADRLEARGVSVQPSELLNLSQCSVARYRMFATLGLGNFSN